MGENLQTRHNNQDKPIIVLQGAESDLKGYIESTLVPYLMLRAPGPALPPSFTTIPEISLDYPRSTFLSPGL